MVERQPSKLIVRVRFPSSAPHSRVQNVGSRSAGNFYRYVLTLKVGYFDFKIQAHWQIDI